MPGIRIAGTGFTLPKKTVTNADLSKIVDTNDEWIRSRTGIGERHFISENENAFTLALSSAKKAIENAKKRNPDFSADQIRVVLTATMTADCLLPTVSALIQKELGLSEEVLAFDLNAACTGYVYTIQTAYALLHTLKGGYALVIGTECLSKILNFEDRSTCVLFGDGAGAAILQKDDSPEAVFEALSGTRGDMQALSCNQKTDGFVHMDGQAVYRFATRALRETIETLLKKSGCTMDDLDYVLCHQANARIIDSVRRRYPEHSGKFFMNMEYCANTSAASVAIALADMEAQGLLKSGMRIIIAAFGAGLSWNGILMTI